MANTPQVYGVGNVISELKQLEPKSINGIRKDLRATAEPIAASIRAYIPNEPPLSGFAHRGRTSWSPSNIDAKVKTNFSKRSLKNEYGIVSIWVGGKKGTLGAAGLQIADMAGRRNKVKTGGRTREYDYMGTKRSHRINGQGRSLIEYMNGLWSTPSRFVWRAALSKLPEIQAQTLRSLEDTFRKVNQNMQVK